MTAALANLRVIDAATLIAGPQIATYLGDFGADVIKVEHPRGDTLRAFGWTKDGTSVYWKAGARNKRAVTLNFGSDEGQGLMRDLVTEADVLIENFRPGTMERWNLGYEQLAELNPGLVMVRVTGFGQDGPYSAKPGFGTLAEAMSGLGSVLGDSDRPPIVPPFPMADGVTALFGTFATLMALHHRDAPGGSGRGQCIDVSLLESMVAFMAPQISAYDVLGIVPERDGSQAPFSAPRGVYQTRDGHWLALSTSAQSVANRLFAAIGRAELAEDPRFSTNEQRLVNRHEVDGFIADWVAARDRDDVLETFDAHDVAVGPVYTAEELAADAHLHAREALVRAPDAELGSVLMHGAFPRMSDTPGEVRHAGPALGADTVEVFGELLGLSEERIAELRERNVV